MSLTSEERIVAVSMPADPTFGITKYERARAIGTRARQISMNSPAHVDATGMVDELEIATLEYYQGKSPLIVRRYYPDHTQAVPHFHDICLRDAVKA